MLMPNQQFIRKDGKIIFIDNQSMNKNRLINVNNPVNPTDIINLRTLKSYINSNDYISETFISGEPISKNRIVIKNIDNKVYIANSSKLSHMDKIIGLSINNSNSNNEIIIATQGIIKNISGVQDGIVYYVSSGGLLTNIAPQTGFTQVVGTGVDTNTLLLEIKLPIGT